MLLVTLIFLLATDPVDVRYRWFRINEDNTRTDVSTSATYAIASGDEDLIHGVVVSYQDPLNIAAGTRTEADEVLTSPIKFSESSYTGSIREDGGLSNLPTIMASVDDAPMGSTITYAFVGDDQGFNIGATSGRITL